MRREDAAPFSGAFGGGSPTERRTPANRSRPKHLPPCARHAGSEARPSRARSRTRARSVTRSPAGARAPRARQQPVYDPGDPMGKCFFNILATFAEFEADLARMREPVRNGRDRPCQWQAQKQAAEAHRASARAPPAAAARRRAHDRGARPSCSALAARASTAHWTERSGWTRDVNGAFDLRALLRRGQGRFGRRSWPPAIAPVSTARQGGADGWLRPRAVAAHGSGHLAAR